MGRISAKDYSESILAELNQHPGKKVVTLSRTAVKSLLKAAESPARSEAEFVSIQKRNRQLQGALEQEVKLLKARAAHFEELYYREKAKHLRNEKA